MAKVEQGFTWPDGKVAAVSLTFDDARPSQVDIGIPLLNRYGFKGTFYVLTQLAERRLPGWQRAVEAGHEIGNHSLSHPCSGNYEFSRANALEGYTLERLEKDISTANDAIERQLGIKPSTFAYPCGHKFVGYGENTRSYVPLVASEFLAGRGFKDEAANSPVICDLAQLTGIEMDGADIDYLRSAAASAVENGSWLVLVAHEVGSGAQAIEPATLDVFCSYLKQRSDTIWVDTVAVVGAYVASNRS